MLDVKRAAGAGTKTKKGYHRVRISITDEFGRTKQKGFEAKTLAEAQAKARKWEVEHGREVRSVPTSGTLSELFEYVDAAIWAKTGEDNKRAMRLNWKKWDKILGESQVDALTAPILTRAIGSMDLHSRSSITKADQCIRQALAYAVSDLGWIKANPALDIRAPKAKPPRFIYEPCSIEDYDRMLELAEPRCKLLIRLTGECGLRPKEAKRATAEDLFTVRDRWLLNIPLSKSEAGERIVPVPDSLAAMLLARKDEDWEGITDPADHLRKWWRENSKTRFYDYRGWYSDNLRRRGISSQVRTFVMGHTNEKFTQQVYETVISQDVLDSFFPQDATGAKID